MSRVEIPFEMITITSKVFSWPCHFFSNHQNYHNKSREKQKRIKTEVFAFCYGKLTISGLCSFEFVPILQAILPHVLSVISLSLTGTSIARKFSPCLTLSSSKVNVASRVLGGLNSSRFIWPMSRLGKTIP